MRDVIVKGTLEACGNAPVSALKARRDRTLRRLLEARDERNGDGDGVVDGDGSTGKGGSGGRSRL